MLTVRERFKRVMNFKQADRLPILEWAPWWDKTIERWLKEGTAGKATLRPLSSSKMGTSTCPPERGSALN